MYNHFLKLRRQIIENNFKKLNDKQKEAVFSSDGPILILAGAGTYRSVGIDSVYRAQKRAERLRGKLKHPHLSARSDGRSDVGRGRKLLSEQLGGVLRHILGAKLKTYFVFLACDSRRAHTKPRHERLAAAGLLGTSLQKLGYDLK